MDQKKIEELEHSFRIQEQHRRLAYSTTVLEDPTSYINRNKYEGLQVWDITAKVPKWASGPAADDPWITWGA